MKQGLLALVAMACVGAYAPSPIAAAADGQAGNHQAAPVSVMNSERDIVLAVANPIEPPATHAGSSLLGYVPVGYYGAGQRAASLLNELKRHYGLHEIVGWPIKALGVYCVVVEAPAGTDRDALLKTLAKDDRVKLVQALQDYSVYSNIAPKDNHRYNDPYVDLQRGFVETDAALAQNLSKGEGVHIAVVDTGADLTHPDLQGRIHDTHDMVGNDEKAFDHDPHGTEVAGIIAADADNHQGIVGIAPESVLSVYKACWYTPASAGAHCNSFTLAKALAAIMDTDARIVNLSLGGPADPLLDKLLAQLLSQGRIVVAALPPNGNLEGFPNNAPGVIVVRVSGNTPAPYGVLSAPGTDILTTQPGGGYDFTSGSSMAAAHVSGIAALLLSVDPHLDARTLHDVLLQSSKTSHGMLQVNAAGAVASTQGAHIGTH